MKRIAAIVMALTLLLALLPGCGGEKTGRAMGRYVESERALPADTVEILGFQARSDGSIELLAYVGTENGVLLKWYESTDGGATWAQRACPAIEEIMNSKELYNSAGTACWDEEGQLYFLYTEYDKEFENPALSVAMVDAAGAFSKFGWPVVTTEGSDPQAIRVAENGDILLGSWAEIQQLDRETGKLKYTYGPQSDEDAVDGWDVKGNTLWLSGWSILRSFDLATGTETASLTTDTRIQEGANYGAYYRTVSAESDGSAYYATDHGLFRAVGESSVAEKLVDGNMSSLGIPTMERMKFAALEEQFLMLLWEGGGYHLFSYDYDPTVPTAPDTELKVWSLRDSPLVRQTIGAFQKAHSDVYVSYTPAIQEEGAVTEDDALKALATELVAGKGPDVLLLDGAPLESYMDKGVLRDLSADITPMIDDGTLLPHVANTYRNGDGTMYAVPAGFYVLLMHGETEGMTSLGALADWAEEHQGEFVHPISVFTPADYIDLFYPISRATDEAGLRSFLSDLKRIYNVEQKKPFDDGLRSGWAFQFQCLYWMGGNVGMGLGGLQAFEYLYPAWQSSQDKGTGSIDTLFGGDEFLPGSVLGVSAQSKLGDLAADFVKTALSEEVQVSKMGGLEVNAAAFQKATEEDLDSSRAGHYSTYAVGYLDAEGGDQSVMLTVEYPPEAWRSAMADRFRGLTTPLIVDDTIIRLLTENTANYFAGEATLDETMVTVMQKLSLYQAELG